MIEGVAVSGIGANDLVTDLNGVISINKSIVNQKNEIRISCIGYQSVFYKPASKYPDTLRLSATRTLLNEVTINSKSKDMPLGNINLDAKGGYLFGPNEEIAEYIPNNDKIKGTITGVEYMLLDGRKGIEKPFKVNLYAKIKGSMYPGEPLIKDSIIVYNRKRLTVLNVDISKYNIQIPEDGFFVSIEILSRSWYGKDLVKDDLGKHLRIPGIKGKFKDGNYRYDETERSGVKYALHRNTDNTFLNWAVFEDGTNFAIGALINTD